eukprot:4911083-Prymnesium_polylepis.2
MAQGDLLRPSPGAPVALYVAAVSHYDHGGQTCHAPRGPTTCYGTRAGCRATVSANSTLPRLETIHLHAHDERSTNFTRCFETDRRGDRRMTNQHSCRHPEWSSDWSRALKRANWEGCWRWESADGEERGRARSPRAGRRYCHRCWMHRKA